MRLDLYQAETARIATEQSALLGVAKQRLADGLMLTPLEQNGVLHALQVLIENAISKAKQRLKVIVSCLRSQAQQTGLLVHTNSETAHALD